MSRLDASITAMAERHPAFRCRRRIENLPDGTMREMGVWRGEIVAIRKDDGVSELLDDLDRNICVYVTHEGELRHLVQCQHRHARHQWASAVTVPFPTFTTEIRYGGERDHPRCWIVRPQITQERLRHRFAEDGSICPFLASEDLWVWDQHTVADFVPYVVLWIAKWVIWDRTGHWPGGEHPVPSSRREAARYHLSIVRPGQQCWCRKGVPYRDCHLAEDERFAA